jgi:hypothetical protein
MLMHGEHSSSILKTFFYIPSRTLTPESRHLPRSPQRRRYLMACAAAGDVRTTLLYLRLVERMRRATAHEYGLCLSSITPKQTFVSRIAETGDGTRQSLHVDECSISSYHYSCVLYLSTQDEDFTGGSFVFSDLEQTYPEQSTATAAGGQRQRLMNRLSPQSGSAILFSSGWENIHFVEPLESGCRFAVPAFFSTSPSAATTESAPADDHAAAETLWRTGLMPESEEDFRELLRDWHYLLGP